MNVSDFQFMTHGDVEIIEHLCDGGKMPDGLPCVDEHLKHSK